MPTSEKSAHLLVYTINATGGLSRCADGTVAPACHPDLSKPQRGIFGRLRRDATDTVPGRRGWTITRLDRPDLPGDT